MNRRLVAAVWLGVVMFGCEKNKYTVVMTPRGDTVERTFTCEKTNPLGPEEVGRLARNYRLPTPPAGDKKYTFTGKFAGKLPGETGGSGWYLHHGTSMGDAFGYSERLWGKDDLAAQITDMQQASDKLVDYLIGWFAAELGREPKFAALREFLNTNLRRDARNLCLYLWMGAAVADHQKKTDAEFYVRILQYLAERGYFDPARIPEMMTAAETDSDNIQLVFVRELVAKKLGYDPRGKLPASLEFLKDGEKTQASLNKYLSTTPEYQARLRAWEAEKKATEPRGKSPAPTTGSPSEKMTLAQKGKPQATAKPDPSDLLTEPVGKFLANISFAADTDEYDVRLACAAAPIDTNGEWDKDNRTITWSKGLDPKNTTKLPAFCYAFWSVPDRKFQEAHFGKIVLEGEDLAGYCIERKGLDEKHGREWDTFLAGLRPGKDLIPQLDRFRFSDETAARTTTKPARPVDTWVEHIRNGLTKQPKKTPTSVRARE